ncbi:MAG TPA: ATP-binding protein [Caulobacteraceae bacterium]|nr:ATP-binding protein [Caulobacteraceae bacterium]
MAKILDDGLDEMAARAYQGLPLRVLVTVGVAALVSLLLPWRLCLTWLGLALLAEGISIFVTRPQALGRKVGRLVRIVHLADLVAGSMLWIALGAALWSGDVPGGPVCAVIIWVSVVFFGQNNAYQSTTGFVVGGALPALAMLIFVFAAPNPQHLPMVPVVGLLILALFFVADGVLRSIGVRERFEAAQRGLATSEAHYRLLADNVTDVIARSSVNGVRRYISPSIEQALGFTAEFLMATPGYSYLYPEDRDYVIQTVTSLTPEAHRRTIDYRVFRKDGGIVWAETCFTLAPGAGPDGDGEVISVSRDISARKALETELVEARRRAEEAAAAKSDFLANMTHELRTPLNAIIGFSGVLADSPRLGAKDARHAGLIRDASESLLDLVNGVLDFSRLEAGAVELEAKPFDPAETARAMVALLTQQADAKDLMLAVEVEGEISPLVGDAARIRQVVLNFLSNAIKFTAAGGVTVSVRQRRADAGNGVLRVAVTDTGPGIAADKIDHLFDRFTQADATVSRQYGGTGLGLAICKRTLELMGGTIGCNSRPGQGSTFWLEVTLPRAEALAEAPQAPAPSVPDAPLRLLLVEDVAVNRELISTLLAPFDVAIETAENGLLAVEAMQRGAFDLVLMDVQMPVMDGLTAARAIRALPAAAAQSTPIIAMTANVLPEQVQKCLDAGMDDHLGKPIIPAALLTVLSRWSAGRDTAARESDAATA